MSNFIATKEINGYVIFGMYRRSRGDIDQVSKEGMADTFNQVMGIASYFYEGIPLKSIKIINNICGYYNTPAKRAEWGLIGCDERAALARVGIEFLAIYELARLAEKEAKAQRKVKSDKAFFNKHGETREQHNWDNYYHRFRPANGVSRLRAFEVLGLHDGATVGDIKKAFRRLAGKCHPDKEGGNHNNFIVVRKAYETLIELNSQNI
jgi:hypothetical protein